MQSFRQSKIHTSKILITQAYMTKVRRIHKGEDTWGNEVPQ